MPRTLPRSHCPGPRKLLGNSAQGWEWPSNYSCCVIEIGHQFLQAISQFMVFSTRQPCCHNAPFPSWIHGCGVLKRFSGSEPLSLNTWSTRGEWPCLFCLYHIVFKLHLYQVVLNSVLPSLYASSSWKHLNSVFGGGKGQQHPGSATQQCDHIGHMLTAKMAAKPHTMWQSCSVSVSETMLWSRGMPYDIIIIITE